MPGSVQRYQKYLPEPTHFTVSGGLCAIGCERRHITPHKTIAYDLHVGFCADQTPGYMC